MYGGPTVGRFCETFFGVSAMLLYNGQNVKLKNLCIILSVAILPCKIPDGGRFDVSHIWNLTLGKYKHKDIGKPGDIATTSYTYVPSE